MHDEINSKSEEDMSNNIELSQKKSEASKDVDSAKTNIETLSDKISDVLSSKGDLWNIFNNNSIR